MKYYYVTMDADTVADEVWGHDWEAGNTLATIAPKAQNTEGAPDAATSETPYGAHLHQRRARESNPQRLAPHLISSPRIVSLSSGVIVSQPGFLQRFMMMFPFGGWLKNAPAPHLARTFPLVQLASRRSARPQVSTRALRMRHAQRQPLQRAVRCMILTSAEAGQLNEPDALAHPSPTPPPPMGPFPGGGHRAGPLPCGAFWCEWQKFLLHHPYASIGSRQPPRGPPPRRSPTTPAAEGQTACCKNAAS